MRVAENTLHLSCCLFFLPMEELLENTTNTEIPETPETPETPTPPRVSTDEIDTLFGGPGNNVFLLQNHFNQLPPLSPATTQIGTNDDDELFGTNQNDVILGRGGNDTIYAFMGDDFIDGQGGNDLIYGGQGNDILSGADGRDTIFGDMGDDIIYGGADDDLLFGNQDNDTIYGDGGNDTIYGGQGDDYLVGGGGNDLLFGDNGNDTLVGISRAGRGYTLIGDFDPNKDTVMLRGLRENYQLVPSLDLSVATNVALPQGTAIIQTTLDGTQQLLAVIQDNFFLDINESYFDFL